MLSNKEEFRMADLLFGQPVEEDLSFLKLSARTHNCLIKSGYTSVFDVCQLNEEQLMSIPNMTKNMVKEIMVKIKRNIQDIYFYGPYNKPVCYDEFE